MGTRETKEFPSAIADIDAKKGIVVTIAAVMGNVDDGSDRILSGAAAKTAQERGSRIKMGWQHDLSHPMGVTREITEVAAHQLPTEVLRLAPDATGGLRTVGQVTLTPTNMERLQLMESAGDGLPPAVDGTSIGYEAVKVGYTNEGGRTIRNIKELKLWEWSPVTLGMNQAAMVVGVKGAAVGVKELTGSFEDLRDRIRDALLLDGRFSARDDQGDPTSWPCIEATFTDRVTVEVYQSGQPDQYFDVAYGFGPAGEIVLGDAVSVEIVSVAEPKAMSLELAMKVLADMKEGRVLSGRSKESINAAMTAMRDAIEALGALLSAAEPASGKGAMVPTVVDHSTALARIQQQIAIGLGRMNAAQLRG